MLQIRSRLDVADNTGARMAKMIGVIGKKNSPEANIGDVITAHVREASTGVEPDEERPAGPARATLRARGIGAHGLGPNVCRCHWCQLRDQDHHGDGGAHGEMPRTSNSHVPLTLPAGPLGRPAAVLMTAPAAVTG